MKTSIERRTPSPKKGRSKGVRCGRLVRARRRRLTPYQINCIADELHEKVQFYDSTGKPSNATVLAQVELVLKQTRFFAP
jgi:hypothetical protein